MTRQRFRWRSDKNEKKSGGKDVTIPENTENANEIHNSVSRIF